MAAKVLNETEWWVRALTRKRGDEIAKVVLHLVGCGLRVGHVTAESAHCIPVSHPNVRGVAMKYLRRCGFEKEVLVYGTTKASHAHSLFDWRLVDGAAAQAVVALVTRVTLGLAQPEKPVSYEQPALRL